jgi:hypothetical protein
MTASLLVHVVTSGGSDLSSWIVAAGTLTLAAATVWLASRTSSMANETQNLALETRDGIKTSTTQFRQERMPIVMPVGEKLQPEPVRVVNQTPGPKPTGFHQRDPPERLPYAIDRGDLEGQVVYVRVENVGAGPALGISADMYFLDRHGARSGASQPMITRKPKLPALAAGKETRMRFEFRGLALPLLAYQLSLEYQDGAGGLYKVTAVFVEEDLAYGEIGFEPPPELQLPGTKALPIPLPKGRIRNRVSGDVADLNQEAAPDVTELGYSPDKDPDGPDGKAA